MQHQIEFLKMAGIRLFKSCCTTGTDFFLFLLLTKQHKWKKTKEKKDVFLFDEVKVLPVSVEVVPAYLLSVVDYVQVSGILVEYLGPVHLGVHFFKLLMYLFSHFSLIRLVVHSVPWFCTLVTQKRKTCM